MWDIFTVILSILNVVMIPVTMSFGYPVDNYGLYKWSENFIDIIFLFDIVIQFLTKTTNKYGDHIDTFPKIAKGYMSTPRFAIDVLALIGTKPFVEMWKQFKYF